MYLFAIRQVGLHIGMFVDKVCYVIQSQPFILWNGDMPHLVPIDRLLDSTDQVFAEVNGHLLVGREVNIGINCQKIIALTF